MSGTGVLLIKRGPAPTYHRAPYHRVIVCAKRHVGRWEAGWSGDSAWVWSHERGTRAGGWLIERWNGFDIDYGHVVRGFTLPDGTDAAFVHEHTGREPWTLLAGAVWWDDRKMPAWLLDAGVIYPPDAFSQQGILLAIGDGNIRSEAPSHWPAAAPLQQWEVADESRIPNGTTVQFVEGIGCYEKPAVGIVTALTATVELPNGRYEDAYSLLRPDGTSTQRGRAYLERLNPRPRSSGAEVADG
jgi:hypothetical protein